jgi:hypothetical protein
MTTQPIEDLPIACDMTALDSGQRARHRDLVRRLRAANRGSAELADGYALRYGAKPRLFLELAEFVALEWRCCPFLRFALEREPADGAVWLRLTGGEGVKEFLQAELRELGLVQVTLLGQERNQLPGGATNRRQL